MAPRGLVKVSMAPGYEVATVYTLPAIELGTGALIPAQLSEWGCEVSLSAHLRLAD